MSGIEDLVLQLPEAERAEGTELIAGRIMPSALAESSDHNLTDAILARVARRLRAAPESGRLEALRALTSEIELEGLARAAQELAIGRFIKEGNEIPPAAHRTWVSSAVDALLELTTVEIERAAADRTVMLDAWQRRVQDDQPGVWAACRTRALHARLALASARTGSFETASGNLIDFLRDVGERPQNFDIF